MVRQLYRRGHAISMKDSLTTVQRNKIQFLRGIAITAVVFIHSMPNGIIQVFLRPLINYPVALFLFLSGLLSTANNWNPKKRIVKIIIPYFIWTFIYSVIYCYNRLDNVPLHFVKYLITASAPAMMYYVYVYIQCTLLIPLIDRMAKSKLWILGLAVSPLEIVVFRLIPLVCNIEFHSYIRIIMRISCLGWFSFFYLGYLLGNNNIKICISAKVIAVFWLFSVVFQIAEGYLYYILGSDDCGTQLKITAVLSGFLLIILSYKYIFSNQDFMIAAIKRLGDISFGIFFSNIAVMRGLELIPGYSKAVHFPINAFLNLIVCSFFVVVCKTILGKKGKYLAF